MPPTLGLALATLLASALGSPAAGQAGDDPANGSGAYEGARLYEVACASCHGADGTGREQSTVGFSEPLPDFTDCSFATREPDSDWYAVASDGGPVRAFSRMMPAFGEALTDAEIQSILDHVRQFCPEASWPRGELNMPRPLITEKAYPEDEVVITTLVNVDSPGAVAGEFLYERRVGSRSQVEIIVPLLWRQQTGTAPGESAGWTGGISDLAVGFKSAVIHSLRSGTILSVGGELILPTGNEDKGLGLGTVALEPFLLAGQVLPLNGFVHFQGGFLLPTSTDRVNQVAFWRAALGTSFVQGRFGRNWSPIVEILGNRALVTGEPVRWAIVPQMQVTLNRRQHIMLNAGVRLPLNDVAERQAQFIVYFLWEWFDGGLFDGW